MPPKTWVPEIDPSFPHDTPNAHLDRDGFFLSWSSAYFEHGDLSKRSLDEIQYIVPSLKYTPSIYTTTAAEREEMIEMQPADYFEIAYLHKHFPERKKLYRGALFDREYRNKYSPLAKITVATGELTHSFEISGHWQMEDDDKSFGGGHVDYWKWLPHANHLVRRHPHSAVLYLDSDSAFRRCNGIFRKKHWSCLWRLSSDVSM